MIKQEAKQEAKEKMVSDIFQAYESPTMAITFYGYPSDDYSRLGIVSVNGRSVHTITFFDGKWNNGLTSLECPLQAARDYLTLTPRQRIERLERLEDHEEGAKIEELILIAKAEHALSIAFNPNKRTESQQRKTSSLMGWIIEKAHYQSPDSRRTMCEQLEAETARLYSAKRDQLKEEERSARAAKPKAVQTDAQIRLANALGLKFGDSDDLGQLIEDEIRGFDALEAVFDNLTSYTSATVQNRSSKIEMVPNGCPFCGVSNGEYVLFTFNNNGSYCFSCKESANIINTALAFRKHAYKSVSHDDSTNDMTVDEAQAYREKKAKKQNEQGARGKKSVWLGAYHKYNMRIYDVNNHDYLQIVRYFVQNKGLNKDFVTIHLLPYLDAHDIRYNYCNYSYKTGERGIALNVPYVADRQRVRAIKRRLMDSTLQQDAKRWNFNIYPKSDHESHLWATYKGESDLVVIVENQLDSAILNLISEKRGMIKDISFAAPLVPKNIDIALGASHHKDTGTIILAYDLDETGDRYVARDFERLKRCGFNVMSYVWDGLESESLLDTMTRTKFGLNELHSDIMEKLGS